MIPLYEHILKASVFCVLSQSVKLLIRGRISRVKVVILYVDGKVCLYLEAEVIRHLVLVSKVEHADGPVRITIEFVDEILLDILH